MNDRRITVREVADEVGISIGSCHNIFSNVLGMKRVAAKFNPKLLNFDQKNNHMNIAQELLNDVNDDPDLLKRVITGDETWVYGYDVETKAQSSQWKQSDEPRPKKARQVGSNVKVLLTVFIECNGVVHHEFLPQGRTVNNCAKQFVRNAQNYGKNNHGFCTMITHQLTHRCLCVIFWPKTKPLSCLNYRIHRTLSPLTFSSSQN